MPVLNKNIDLNLSVLCIVAKNRILSLNEIANICECSKFTIRSIELRAIKKLKIKFKKNDFFKLKKYD